jgi:hypothetical protein
VNASDTLSVGQNGLMICGYSPLPLLNGESDTTDKEGHDTQKGQNQWSILTYKQSPFPSSSATSNGSHTEFRTKVQKGKQIEISFNKREEMNDWIETILSQYETCSDNVSLQNNKHR